MNNNIKCAILKRLHKHFFYTIVSVLVFQQTYSFVYAAEVESAGLSNSTTGIAPLNASSVRFFVNTNAWADLHYIVNGGVQLNVRMNVIEGANRYDVSGLNTNDTINYRFTYWDTGCNCALETPWLSYTHSTQSDADNDGVVDSVDQCPNTPAGDTVDSQGCTIVSDTLEVSVSNGILVGGAGSAKPGFSLYVFDADINSGGSTCDDSCAASWPPLLVSDGVASGLPSLGTVTRNNGSKQVTYQGRPLYFYAADNKVGDRKGHGVGGVWWLVEFNLGEIVPLYNSSTVLEPAIVTETDTALITRISDRARDRHAREDQFKAYDHYLSFYWEDRTATIEIIDRVAKGGSTVTFNVVTQHPLQPGQEELRFFYRGIGTVAEYHLNTTLQTLGNNRYTYTVDRSYPSQNPLQVGERMEFELSQFLQTPLPNGRANYYGTTMLYIVGRGIVPWEARGVFGDPSTEREDSYPIPEQGWLGGQTTLPYQYSDEPDNHFMQMAGNLSSINGQPFVLGRRVHHTDFGDGSHDESPENSTFPELSNQLGNRYINRSCVACHVRNGRALPPVNGVPLNQYVVKVGDASGAPDPQLGGVLQPQSNGVAVEASVSIGGWTETNGLRKPEFSFSGVRPTNFSARITPQLVGLGLLEAIDETTIQALADPDDSKNSDGISGRMQVVIDPETGQARMGRFGWKAGAFSVRHQVAKALNTDIGVTSSMLPSPDCGAEQSDCGATGAKITDEHFEQLAKYVALLGVSARRGLKDAIALRGEALFTDAGCAACHIPSLTTGRHHPYAELRNQVIHPYTDLLLHDMGPGLADNLPEGQATGSEWRTAPLWNIGLTESVSGGEAYLHDGRARSLSEAILWHGGEALSAKQAFEAMSVSDREAVIAFLKSL